MPIGLITNAYPGSYISSWLDSALAIDNCNLGKNGNSNERNWYCGRIYPLRNLKLSGVFWYQGEADATSAYSAAHEANGYPADQYEYYKQMLPKLITSWRDIFNDDELPFYYVQLSRIGSTIVDENNPDTGAAGKMPIKRAQTDVYLDAELDNTGIISTLDLYGNHDADGTANCRTDIHLGQKNIIGERMAGLALSDIYNKTQYSDGSSVYRMGPMYKSSEVEGDTVIITFDCNGQLAVMPSSQYTDTAGEQKITDGEFDPDVLNEFEIYGTKEIDGIPAEGWYSASVRISGRDKVTVSAEGVTNPTKVRYCGKDYPESPNLTDESGLPSYVFERTVSGADETIPSPTPSASTEPDIVETYKFDFGSGTAAEGYKAVTPDMVFDMSSYKDEDEGYCGFLGTEEDSYKNDVLGYDCDNRAIDGFTLVKGQKITLASGGEASDTDADSDYIAVPAKESYIPFGASEYEGRFPIRFSMKAERKAYYTVTVTLVNSSDTENACVSLFSEKRQIIAEDVTIKPSEKITFKFSVDIEDKKYKNFSVNDFTDDMLNVTVSGKNAAISSMIVEKHGKTAGKIKGSAQQVNDGVTMWLCTDSTGCDYGAKVPFFALQNYGGTGQALSKYVPENIAVSNQGEGGLSTGDSAHFNNCMLKEGDYLYVQYGHNENGTDLYKSNLEAYYNRAHESGAKLILVSPVNRHKPSDYSNGQWRSSFGGYIASGREFVESKIADGASDIAYVDMNTPYVEWMNEETDRIVGINPSIPRQSAINFYYYSAKGTSVDGAHLNDAGADNGAYCFFMAAKAVVEAADESDASGELSDEQRYILTQAEVLRPLVTEMKTTVGDSDIPNTPIQVPEEIIKAGAAPNAYWDTVPSEYFEYDNAAAVDSVEYTSNADGSMTVLGVGIRIMNPITYAKAVITVNDDGTETKYYTENNYDCTGVESGAVLVNSGFITSDKNHSEVTDSDRAENITVPVGASCTVQIFECDEYWVVGESKALSTVYNIYPEVKTVFDEDGSSIEGWNVVTGAASHTEEIVGEDDGSYYISISSNNADSGGSKKNYGFYKQLNENMETGVYRMSFKTRFGAGTVRFVLASKVKDASNPFEQKVYPLVIEAAKIYVNSDTEDNRIYTFTDDEGERQYKINANQWINVDAVVDLNNGRLLISAAGSDYREVEIASWHQNNPLTLPIKYFGIAGSNDGTPTMADIKDIKIIKLESEAVRKIVTVSVNNEEYGTASVKETADTTVSVDVGESVTAAAQANEGYRFVNWTDADGAILSTDSEYTISRVYSDTKLTANFEPIPENQITWDFSEFDEQMNGTGTAEEIEYNGLKISLHSTNDYINSAAGVFWNGGAASGESTRYIAYTPEEDGILYAEGKCNASGGRWGISETVTVTDLAGDESSSTAVSKGTVYKSCIAGTAYYIIPKSKSASIIKVWFIPSENSESKTAE